MLVHQRVYHVNPSWRWHVHPSSQGQLPNTALVPEAPSAFAWANEISRGICKDKDNNTDDNDNNNNDNDSNNNNNI